MELGLGLQVTLIGMVIVFATLYALSLAIKIPRIAMGRPNKAEQPKHILEVQGVQLEHQVVIAAAIAALDRSYRIAAIEVAGNENWEQSRYTEITSLQ